MTLVNGAVVGDVEAIQVSCTHTTCAHIGIVTRTVFSVFLLRDLDCRITNFDLEA